MKHLGSQRGFTLFELVIVLAISSLMVSTVIVGQGVLQQNSSVTSALDAVKNQIKAVQSDANTVVSARTTVGGASALTNFGKLIIFDNSAAEKATMKTWTLVGNADSTSLTALAKCDERDVSIQQGVEFTGSTVGSGSIKDKQAIVFTNNPNKTYVVNDFTEALLPPAFGISCSSPGTAAAPTVPVIPGLVCGRTQAHPEGTACPLPAGPPRQASACDDEPGWQCGLYGQYYDVDTFDPATKIPISAYLEAVGPDMGPDLNPALPHGSSSPTFLPALPVRTAKAPADAVSVHWSGQLKINDNSAHTFCFSSDDGSKVVINGQTLTDNYTSNNPIPNACTVVTVDLPSWVPIDIQYPQHDSSSAEAPKALLYESLNSGVKRNVEKSELRTVITNVPFLPHADTISGLYGQYYDRGFSDDLISKWTDPYIGASAGGNSFSTSPDFISRLTSRAATATAGETEVLWSGQVLVDTPTQKYCTTGSDDYASFAIDGSTNGSTNAWGGSCTSVLSLLPGWHDINIKYANTCCFPPSAGSAKAMLTLNGTQVPTDHLRRSMLWAATGADTSCPPAAYPPYCHKSGTVMANEGSSSKAGGGNATCTDTNKGGNFAFSKSGLTPGSNYNVDLSYHNYTDSSGKSVKNGYPYYLVCIRVNGTLLSPTPYYLDVRKPADPQQRTVTIPGITVPASGNFKIEFDWLNDSASDFGYIDTDWPFIHTGAFNMNLAIDRMELYGTLPPSVGSGPAPTPKGAKSLGTTNQQNKSLASALLRWVLPVAHADVVCDTNILNPTNYSNDCFGASTNNTARLNLRLPGSSQIEHIDINTVDGSIDRSFE